MEKIDSIELLEQRIDKCLELSAPKEKYQNTKDIISRSKEDLLNIEFRDAYHAKQKFGNFTNKTLSAIEAIGLPDMQYAALRKLVLSEIYGCLYLLYPELKEEAEKRSYSGKK